MTERKKIYEGLMMSMTSLNKAIDDLDLIHKSLTDETAKSLVSAISDTLLGVLVNVRGFAVTWSETSASTAAVKDENLMMADFIAEKGIMSDYLKHREKYD